MGFLEDLRKDNESSAGSGNQQPAASSGNSFLDGLRQKNLVAAGSTLTGQRQFLPAQEIASSIARLRANPATAKRAEELQRAFQDSLSDADLQRAGLERLDAPNRSFLDGAKGLLAGTLDVITRPGQAVLQAGREGRKDGVGGILEGLVGGITGRGERANVFDLVGGTEGERELFGINESGAGAGTLRFAGEAVLDPINLLSFGGGAAARNGLRIASTELGEGVAEQLARRGLDALADPAVLRTASRVAGRELDEAAATAILRGAMGPEQFSRFGRQVRGGLQLNIPGATAGSLGRRTLVPGEVFRAPLRSAGVLDPVRRAAVRSDSLLPGVGAAADAGRRSLQTTARESAPVSFLRDSVFQARGAVSRRFGQNTADELGLAVTEAAAKAGLASEQSVKLIDDIAKSARRSIKGLPPEQAAAVFADVTRAVDGGDAAAAAARLRANGHAEAADLIDTLVDEMADAARKTDAVGERTFRPIEAPGAGREAVEDPLVAAGRGAPTEQAVPETNLFGEITEPAVDVGSRASRNVRGQIPGQQRLVGPGTAAGGQGVQGLDRVALPGARRTARRGGAETRKGLDLITGSRTTPRKGDLLEANEQARRLLGLREGENAIETNVSRLVAMQQLEANRAVALDELAEKISQQVVDPETGQTLALIGDSPQVASQARQFGYDAYRLGDKTIWTAPEAAAEITRMNQVVFSDPTAVGRFGQVYDQWMNLWKGMATVPPIFGTGFHARNLTGNLFNNYLAGGITVRHYRAAIRYQSAIKDAQTRVARQSPQDALSAVPASQRSRPTPSALPDAPAPPEGGLLDRAFRNSQQLSGGLDSLIGGVPPAAAQVDAVARDAVGDLPKFEKALREVASDHGLKEKDIKAILLMRDQGVISSGFFKSDLHEDAVAGMGTSERVNYFRRVARNPQEMFAIRWGSNIGHALETNARMAHFLGKIDEGFDAASAMLSVKKHLFDYGDLTSVERQIFRRVVPFYTFMRKNTPLQFQNIILEPRKIVAAQRLQQAVASVGGDTEFTENKALPQWAVDRGDVPLGQSISELLAGDDSAVLFGIEFPTQAAFDVVEPWIQLAAITPGFSRLIPDNLTPDERNNGIRSILNLPGGGAIEFAKVLAEQGFEQDLFTGAPVDDRDFLRSLAGAATPFTEKGLAVWDDLTADSDNGESNRFRARMIRNIFGLNMTVVDPRRERAELFRRLDILEDTIERAKDAGVLVPTLTDLREGGLAPTLSELRTQ